VPRAGAVLSGALYLLLGLALLTHAWRCWSGRSRAWVRRTWSPQVVLGLLPGLGFAALAAGVQVMVGPWAGPVVAVLMTIGFVLLVLGIVYIVFEPSWWGPRWFRRLPARDRMPDISDPLTAATVGFSRRPAAASGEQVRRAAGRLGGRPVARWGGGYVYDPDTSERAHGMARRGTVMGDLTLYPHGLTFAAKRWEDVLRDEPTVLVLPSDEIRTVRVVPARAGADGETRRGRLWRSVYPRLVVESTGGRYVFDVAFGGAARAASRIGALVGRQT
jgi:hypothetical protein